MRNLRTIRSEIAGLISVMALVAISGLNVNAQPGGLDTSFSGDGLASFGLNPSKELAVAGLVQSDGMVVMVANVSEDNPTGDNEKVILKRYTSSVGSGAAPDPAFGTNGAAFFSVGGAITNARSAKLQSNGKIVIVGDYWSGTNFDIFITRLNANGTLDYGFGNLGITTFALTTSTDSLDDVAIHSDGKIFGIGNTVQPAGTQTVLIRLNSNGTPDAAFGVAPGYVIWRISSQGEERFRSIAIQSNGRVVVSGYVKPSTNKEMATVRFNYNGSLDGTFNTTGKAITSFSTVDDEAFKVRVQSDGKIVAVGSTLNTQNFAMIRLLSNGTIDTTFDSDGKVSRNLGTEADVAYGIVIQSNGKYIVVGKKTENGVTFPSAVRWNTNGSLDTTFYSTGQATWSLTGTPISAELRADGSIFSALGEYGFGNSDTHGWTFSDNGSVSGYIKTEFSIATTYDAIQQPDGKILVAGEYHYWKQKRCFLIRLHTNGVLDTSFDGDGRAFPNFNAFGLDCFPRKIALQSDGKIVLAGQLGDYGFVGRLNSNGSLDTSFNTYGYATIFDSASVSTLAIDQSNSVYTTSGVNAPENYVYKFLANGTPDTSFGGDGTVAVDVNTVSRAFSSLVVQADGKLLAAGSISFSQYHTLARFNLDGTYDTSFSGDGLVFEGKPGMYSIDPFLKLRPDGKIVMASSGSPSPGFGLFDAIYQFQTNGERDPTFGSTAPGYQLNNMSSTVVQKVIAKLDLDANGKILLGRASEDYRIFLIRLTSTGSLDPTWSGDGIFETTHGTTTFIKEISGKFTFIGNDYPHLEAARYLP